MSKQKNKAQLFLPLILLGAYLLAFILHYITTYITSIPVLIYTSYAYGDLLNSLFPIIALCPIVIVFLRLSIKRAFLIAIPLSLIPLIYSIPYNAFKYAYAGYEIGTVLLFALLSSLLYSIIVYAVLCVLLLVFKLASGKAAQSYSMQNALSENEPFNFSQATSIGFFSACAVIFIYNLAIEIIDTVNYLINYSGTYTAGEIIYMALRYVFILATLLASQYVAQFTKNKLLKQ